MKQTDVVDALRNSITGIRLLLVTVVMDVALSCVTKLDRDSHAAPLTYINLKAGVAPGATLPSKTL